MEEIKEYNKDQCVYRNKNMNVFCVLQYVRKDMRILKIEVLKLNL